jgi:hypothetical protein
MTSVSAVIRLRGPMWALLVLGLIGRGIVLANYDANGCPASSSCEGLTASSQPIHQPFISSNSTSFRLAVLRYGGGVRFRTSRQCHNIAGCRRQRSQHPAAID